MKKFKLFLSFMLFALLAGAAVLSPTSTFIASAEGTQDYRPPYNKKFTVASAERECEVTLDYQYVAGLVGEFYAEISIETNEDTLKQFEKYCKKKIDAASIGEVFYVTKGVTNEEDKNRIYGTYSYKVKLPKFYHNKDVAVIPFNDYRSPQTVKSVTVNDEGYISFLGSSAAYAYAVVYNGVYKDIILIGIILLAILIICVVIKILCLRRDNPYIQDKKKEKAIAKKKAEHKNNKKIAKELKRQKEKLNKGK